MQLSRDYRTLSFRLGGGKRYCLVVDRKPVAYEREIARSFGVPQLARILMQAAPGGTLIDVGANIGTICIPYAAGGGSVIAIEMLPENCSKLRAAAQLNALSNVEIVACAASDREGTVHYAGEYNGARVGDGKRAAKAKTIDAILVEHASLIRGPVALKIDVEQHEYQVLLGAEHSLARWQPIVLFESIATAPFQREVKRFLAERGYALYLHCGHVFAPRTPDDPQEVLVADFLAVPKERTEALPELLPEYAFRPLSMDEQRQWLRRLAASRDPAHATHARQYPFSEAVAPSLMDVFKYRYLARFGALRAIARALNISGPREI